MADQEHQIYRLLCKEVQRHNFLYFEKSAPEIDDAAFDQLMVRIRKLEQEHPEWIDENSPTQRLGEEITPGFAQVAHRLPMLSFDKVFDRAELAIFDARLQRELKGIITYSVEAKLDGCAISVCYRDGKLERAVTRGNGKLGDDVTANLATIESLPQKLKGVEVPKFLELRGEVFLRQPQFEKINEKRCKKGLVPFANPRNLTSGTLKMLQPDQVAQRGLSLLFYAVAEESSRLIETFEQGRQAMRAWGLPVLQMAEKAVGIDDVFSAIEKLSRLRSTLDFGIDGAVIKIDHLATGIDLGYTGQYYRWGIAYKFSAERALTQIERIELQVGRTGVITPVAHLTPVELAGTKVSRATLHNAEEIRRKDIRVNDFVFVEKGGDIIPKVAEVVVARRSPNTNPWRPPQFCPFCQSPLMREIVHLRCRNPHCGDQLLARLRHFVSKAGMDIAGLGGKVLQLLIDRLGVDSPAKLYALQMSDLSDLPGFANRSAQALCRAIAESRNRPLGQFLNALGIPQIGKGAAENLARYYESLENLQSADLDSLQQVGGIGEKAACSIFNFFKADATCKMVRDLLASGIQPINAHLTSAYKDHPFRGKRFAITGSLDTWDRHELEKLLEERGGIVTASLSKNVDFLIVGKNPGSKIAKADKWQIAQIYENQLQAKLFSPIQKKGIEA